MDKTLFFVVFIAVTVFGACIGSFLNVVIFRLPEGMSLSNPPSQCPACKYHLAWYDNIPIVSWFVLDAKCRNCGVKISSQYPLIEGLTAVLYAVLFVLYFAGATHQAMYQFGPDKTWAVYLTHMILIGSLLAATVIDIRFLQIPIGLPITITVAAVALLPISTGIAAENFYLVPTVAGHNVGLALGGGVGLLIAWALLEKGVIPRSFLFNDDMQWIINGKPAGPAFGILPVTENKQAEAATPTEAASAPAETSAPNGVAASPAPEASTAPTKSEEPPQEQWLPHPNPRGEMAKELMFLAIPILGAIIGYFIVPEKGPEGRVTDAYGFEHVIRSASGWQNLPMGLHVLAGVVFGALVGGAIAWFFRIAGTYVFGKEAMGMGDVHILAAIGAVVGAEQAFFIFFLAAVLGLIGSIATGAANNLLAGSGRFKMIPYGPYLALATLLTLFAHDPVDHFMLNFYKNVGASFSVRM